MWDVLSRDYSRSLSPRKCLKNVTKHLEPGAIVVFHDSEKIVPNMRYALPRIGQDPEVGAQMQNHRIVTL